MAADTTGRMSVAMQGKQGKSVLYGNDIHGRGTFGYGLKKPYAGELGGPVTDNTEKIGYESSHSVDSDFNVASGH